MNPKKKRILLVLSTALTLFVAILGAYNAMNEVRLVTVLTIFGGAFGAGASFVTAITEFKKRR